ncbi:MAG TPA: metalloregulator ArsR/SmtB family transcription factor [Candidatus Dormibacteraeota bacterium]
MLITVRLNNHQVMQAVASDSLSLVFGALADPTRRQILQVLAEGEASVGELARPFRISQPAVSKHLAVLERAGLVAKTRQAQWRQCRLTAEPLKEVASYMDGYRRFWDESFSRLDEHLRQLQEAEAQEAEKENSK